MRTVRTGFEFRMSLRGNEEGMRRNLNPFDNMLIRREADRNKACFPEGFAIIIIDFITMAMTFRDILRSIKLIGFRFRIKMAGISAKTPRSA